MAIKRSNRRPLFVDAPAVPPLAARIARSYGVRLRWGGGGRLRAVGPSDAVNDFLLVAGLMGALDHDISAAA
jgi:hypothetical protein